MAKAKRCRHRREHLRQVYAMKREGVVPVICDMAYCRRCGATRLMANGSKWVLTLDERERRGDGH